MIKDPVDCFRQQYFDFYSIFVAKFPVYETALHQS